VISATESGGSAADESEMRWLTPCLVVVCFTACMKTVDVSHDIQPSRPNPSKSSEKAGVVCSERLLAGVARASQYRLELGEPLCNALLRTVEGSYRSAQRATKPYAGEFGRVVQFDLQSRSLDIQRRGDGSTRVACSITVVVERYGRDLKRTSRQAVSGNGFVERRDATDAIVREAAETALQQVADNASSLLVAGLDGPRVQASPPSP
jgi:hypothetical protein